MIQGSFAMEQQSNREWTRTHGFLRNSKNPSLHAVDNFLPSFLLSKKKVAVQGSERADSETACPRRAKKHAFQRVSTFAKQK